MDNFIKISIVGLLLLFVNQTTFAQQNDTTTIVFFLDSNIQQYKGVEWHRISKFIPRGNYKKAFLKVDLGCASYGCCAWDYTYRGFFSKRVNDTLYNDTEVARLITPYSSFMRKAKNGYDSTWVHPYVYDVTDYLPIIRDSLIYSAHTGGWDNKGKFGFKHTVTLYLISGESHQPISRVIPMYQDGYRYRDSIQFDELMSPVRLKLTPNEKAAKFRMILTGHDQQGEFSPIPFYLRVNGMNIYQKRLWKTDCDRNPIQPQSGTWVFSRCNWCPGEKVREIEVDLTPYLALSDNEVEISLGKIETKDTAIHANYLIHADMITYTNSYPSDIELMEIVAPSSKFHNKIYNPICQFPKLRVKNYSDKTARNIVMKYNLDQNHPSTFFWKGELMPFEERIIEGGLFDIGGINSSSLFQAELKKNEYNTDITNDKLSTRLLVPDVYHTDQIVVSITTSNDTSINKLNINRIDPPTYILNKEYLNNMKTYRDTLYLVNGSYTLDLTDYDRNYECGDGLNFWYSAMADKKTVGIFKLIDGHTGSILKVFNPDFGGKLEYQFRIENKSSDSNKRNQAVKKPSIDE